MAMVLAAARVLLEIRSAATEPSFAEVLAEGRRCAETQPKLTAKDYIAKAERLARTAAAGDQLAQRIIEAYKRMAQHARDQEM